MDHILAFLGNLMGAFRAQVSLTDYAYVALTRVLLGPGTNLA